MLLIITFRYLNVTLHIKPYNLQHPSELWKHTAFTDQAEYDAFIAQPSMLGKPTASHPHGGMKQKYHDFADKLWNKFKVVRREIASQTSVIWANLLPGNNLPSGVHMPEIVHRLRLRMFEKWRYEPTSKGSKQVYSEIQMDGPYVGWCPTWFPTWRSMGPAAGTRCSQVFMSECCGYQQTSDAESQVLPGPLSQHYQDQVSNVQVVSRAAASKLRQIEEAKLKEERSATKGSKEESKQVARQSQEKSTALFLELELSKEKRLQRADEIDRLKYMITRATVPQTKSALEDELDVIYATPISSAPSSSSGGSSNFRSPSSVHPSPCLSPILPKILAATLPIDRGTSVAHAPIEVVNAAPVEVSQPIISKAAQKKFFAQAPSATLLAQQENAVATYNDALRHEEVCVCVCVSVCVHHIGLIIFSSDTHSSSGEIPGFNQRNIYNRHCP
jgi:hypothetical protein